ncbi:class I SAM-dependent methyltransferase [Streptomyces sp. NPDC005708]|uniref:class I SAM-dependent methyltransferase n=1 Tax=Streptomyces sp. NPDC005708 TaxID=3154564 RepID=UPI0033E63F13
MSDDTAHAKRDERPEESRRVRLGRIFDEDAELYDRARPGYPPELYDDLVELAGACPGSRVREVGCGTGRATVPLAGRGRQITAVEAGAHMTAVAAAVEVVTADFENWPLPEEPFDAVVSATVFHWIDPAVRTAKAADAPRPGGALAVVPSRHVMGGTEEFFVEVQRCYERWDPDSPPGLRPPAAAGIDGSDHAEEVAQSGRFGPTVFRRYEQDLTYGTSDYLELLRTCSGHRALPEAARDGLMACIAGLIDGWYGGRVTKRYLIEPAVSPRR